MPGKVAKRDDFNNISIASGRAGAVLSSPEAL